MQLAARSYLAAGVALVGASAIAVSPVAPAAPQVNLPVVLTAAVDNPLTVFQPVATATQTLISNVIERQTTNPAPIPRQLIANAIALSDAYTADPINVGIKAIQDGKAAAAAFGPNLIALGETTSAAATALSAALSELGAGLPEALQVAAALVAEGDAGAALDSLVQAGMQSIINILVFAVSPQINAIGHVLNVPQPIINAASEAALGTVIGLAAATVGVGMDLDGQPRAVVKQLLVGAQDVADAVASGDLVNVVNAVQHSVADFTESAIFQIDQTISMGNYAADGFVNALKAITPKSTVVTTKSLIAPAPVAIEAATTADVATTAEPATEEIATTESAPAVNADNASGAEADGAVEAPETEAAKVSTKASPKASSKAHVKGDSPAKTVRDQMKSAVKKATNGLKKNKAEKAGASNDSAKGANE
ncbi:hypothetical protein [Mycolicibacterium sp. XJ870]